MAFSQVQILSVSPFLVFKRLQSLRPSLSTKGQIQRVAYQGREGSEETNEEQSRNNSVITKHHPGSSSRNIYDNVFGFFSRS